MHHDHARAGKIREPAPSQGPGTLDASPEPSPDDPAALAVRASLLRALDRIAQSAPGARRGDTEGVHRLRTTTRRLRSELRAFMGLVEATWADRLEAELKWLAGALGAVRDLDVLRLRLCEAAGDSAEALGPLFRDLAEQHARASEGLREALDGPRYAALVQAIAEAAERPRLEDDAWEPCRSALPAVAAGPWKRLKARGRALGPDLPDEDFHEVRKRAKRARYAAEAIVSGLGPKASKRAGRFAARVGKLQERLGALQDAVVAAGEIRRVLAENRADAPLHLAAGRLLEREEQAARQAREAALEAWERLDRGKNLRWMAR